MEWADFARGRCNNNCPSLLASTMPPPSSNHSLHASPLLRVPRNVHQSTHGLFHWLNGLSFIFHLEDLPASIHLMMLGHDVTSCQRTSSGSNSPKHTDYLVCVRNAYAYVDPRVPTRQPQLFSHCIQSFTRCTSLSRTSRVHLARRCVQDPRSSRAGCSTEILPSAAFGSLYTRTNSHKRDPSSDLGT